MNKIKDKLIMLEKQYKDLNILLDENLSIDDKTPEFEDIIYILNINKEIINEIDNFIKNK